MKRSEKESLVQFWMDKVKHNEFVIKCNEKGYSQSGWLRAQIEKFIKEGEK